MTLFPQRFSFMVRLALISAVFLFVAWHNRVHLMAQEDGYNNQEQPQLTTTMSALLADRQPAENLAPLSAIPCVGGMAGSYPCHNIDLLSFIPLSTFGAGAGNDSWGWTDPLDGKEYALMGLNNGTGFVDISDPENPIYLGKLPTHTGSSSWRDIKVYSNHAFIVSDSNGAHGMQVFDLTLLRNVVNPPVTFSETTHYNQFGSAHNLAINEDTGFAYVVGSGTCSGGLHMINIQNPVSPTFAGCFSSDGYTHDTQCVIYTGPDIDHQGKEICFNANEDTLTIVDVSNKAAPVQLSRTGYSGYGYTHQGWLTEDQVYFLLDDELDELNFGHNTRTRIWNVSNLDLPVLIDFYEAPVSSIDHNLYILGGLAYEANYRSGLRILDITDVANGNLSEVGYFDIYPANDIPGFNGAWSNYPYYASGVVIISGIEQGLFIVRPTFDPQVSVDPASLASSQPTDVTQTEVLSIYNQGGTALTWTIDEASSAGCATPQDIPWLDVAPASGTTASYELSLINVDFDSTGLALGTYTAALCINSNDPATPQVEVPITLTVVETIRDVELSGNMAASGAPGTTVTYTLSITNTGSIEDTFDLTVSGVWTATLSASNVTLAAGAATAVQVWVEVPDAAAVGASDVTTVTATNSAVTATAQLTTTAEAVYSILLSGDSALAGIPGSTVTYTITLTNTGNITDTFNLEIVSGWVAVPSGTSFNLAAGAGTNITVAVTIPAGANEGDSEMTMVTVASAGNPSVSAMVHLTTTAGMTQPPLYLPVVLKP